MSFVYLCRYQIGRTGLAYGSLERGKPAEMRKLGRRIRLSSEDLLDNTDTPPEPIRRASIRLEAFLVIRQEVALAGYVLFTGGGVQHLSPGQAVSQVSELLARLLNYGHHTEQTRRTAVCRLRQNEEARPYR